MLNFIDVRTGFVRRSAKIAGIGVGTIVVATAIWVMMMPLELRPKIQNNELSAIQFVRTIMVAENMYETNYPTIGFACSLASLGGDPKIGAPSATYAQLIQPNLALGVKSGYRFAITNCTKVNNGDSDRITGYRIMAVPLTVGQTGNRGFCADQSGDIKFDPSGGTNCDQKLFH